MGLSRQTHGPTLASFPLPSPQAGGQETCYAPSSVMVPPTHTSPGQSSGDAVRHKDATSQHGCPASPHQAQYTSLLMLDPKSATAIA